MLVVGAGPSGLSAAYHLSRRGHEVEVRDASAEPGGMMRYGIPAYRLPRDVLSAEVERIAALGVRIVNGHHVEDLEAERRSGSFDAVFVAVGAHLARRVDIPARDAGRILDALSFLERVASGERPVLGRRVAIYGGGDTAMDAARTARRLGADEALIVYRRTRERMPAHEEEAASRAFSTCRGDVCPSAVPAPDRRGQSRCDVPCSRSEASRERASSSVTSRRSLRALSNQAW